MLIPEGFIQRLALCWIVDSILALQIHIKRYGGGETLLSMAVRMGDKATADVLIEAGADVNARNQVRAVQLRMLLFWPPPPRTEGTVPIPKLARSPVKQRCM